MSGPIPAVTEAAPAKVNLSLHVTGQRADGYHLLDSLVVFVDVADRVTLRDTGAMSLRVTGPRAEGVPEDARNLVWKAAALMAPAAITLEKHLPAAAGIGGGSSDAAACLRGLARLGLTELPEAADLVTLGADVPVCMSPRPQRMQGVGEQLSPVSGLPPLWMVLINPGVEVPTPAVFKTLERRDNPAMPATLPQWRDAESFARWLASQRNDLEPPAVALAPVITRVLEALASQRGCALARMSGSGATCFGLFTREDTAQAAVTALSAWMPSWWMAAGAVRRR